MPRIPMANQPEMIQHQRSTAPLSGGPGMGFGLQESEAFARFGKSVETAGERMGQGMQEFAKEWARSNDTIASSKAESLYAKIDADLQTRMAENPNEFANFEDWAREADQKYENESRQYIDKMSPVFREVFTERMKGVRAETLSRRARTGIQAKVTANYNLFQTEFRNAALSGNEEQAGFLLERERGHLISEQEYQQKRIDFETLRDSGAAKRLVESGADDIADRLRARNPDGSFVEFGRMETAYRDRLTRAAEANDAQRRADENQALLDRLNSGEQVTPEEIDRTFEGRENPASVKQKNQQKKILSAFYRSKQAAENQAAREERRESREAAQEARQRRKEETDAHEYRLFAYQFDNDPAKRKVQYADLRNEILTKYAGDWPGAQRLLGQLDKTFKAAEKPDSSYRKTFVYKNSMERLEGMEEKFTSLETYPKHTFWTGPFMTTSGSKAPKYVTKSNKDMAKIKLDEFLQNNPAAGLNEANQFIDEMVKEVNKKSVQDLVGYWTNLDVSNFSRDAKGEIKGEINGRRAVFGKDHKFIRWEDGK